MTKITTREARAPDAPDLVKMIKDLSLHHDDVAQISEEELVFLCFGPTPWLRVSVAEQDGEILGYAALQKKVQLQFTRRFVDVQHLFVKADKRRQGVGRALLQDAQDYAVLQRCEQVALGVAPLNTKAHAFYQKLGFEPHDRGDALLMIRALPLQNAHAAP